MISPAFILPSFGPLLFGRRRRKVGRSRRLTKPRQDNPAYPACNLPLRAGKVWLYEGGIRSLLLISYPQKIKAAQRLSEPVVSTDIFPTILGLAGLPAMPDQHVDGVDLALRPTWRDSSALWPDFSNRPARACGGAPEAGALPEIYSREGSASVIHLHHLPARAAFSLISVVRSPATTFPNDEKINLGDPPLTAGSFPNLLQQIT